MYMYTVLGDALSRHECARLCLAHDSCVSFAYDYLHPVGKCFRYTSSCTRDEATVVNRHTYDRSNSVYMYY